MGGLYKGIYNTVRNGAPPQELSPLGAAQFGATIAAVPALDSLGAVAVGMAPEILRAEAMQNQSENIARKAIAQQALASAKKPLPQQGSNVPNNRPVQPTDLGRSMPSKEKLTAPPQQMARAGVLQAIRNAMQSKGLL